MHFWCNTSIKPANRKKRTKTKTKTQTVYKVVFSPSNRSTYVVIKKKKQKQNKQTKKNQKKNNPERIFKNPLKLTYNLGYSYIRYSVIH